MKYTLAVAALLATAAAEDKKPEAPKCTIGSFKMYTDKDCKTEDKTTKEADQTKVKTKLTAAVGCTGKVKVTCDGTGITTQTYKEDECKGDADGKATVMKWGDCTQAAGSTTQWIKVSGAKAVMAGASIALAFVGSQF